MRTQPPKPAYFSTAFKVIVSMLTIAGTLATILTTMRQEGMIGPLATVGADVANLRITPGSDTAWAIGDTMHFSVTASDTNGVTLVAPQIEWGVTNTEVATVGSDGTVIATGAGETSVVATAGRATTRARVVVHPRVVTLRLPADTLELPEGASTSLIALPYDVHGRLIRGPMAEWRAFDTTVITVDSLGLATGLRPGRVMAEGTLDGVNVRLVVKVTPVLGSLALGSGGGQHAPASTTLLAPIVVRTRSRQGGPIGGVLVRAAVDGGALARDTVRSDEAGEARFIWTLGEHPGPLHLTARADEIDSTLVVTVEADPVPANTRFVLVDSLGSAAAGAPLPDQVVVRLTDTLGQVLPDVPVRWLGMDGSRIIATAPRTDSLGLATATWTLGPKVGRNRARLIAGPGNAPAFPLEADSKAGRAARIVVVRGDEQRGVVAARLPRPVVFRVTDNAGNPVADAAIGIESGDGTSTDPVRRTDRNGYASLSWNFGPTAGTQHTAVGVQEVTGVHVVVTGTALPAPAAEVEIVAPAISIVTSGTLRVVAMVSDSLGNPIRGNVVQPRVTMGSVTPLRATTGPDGKATFTWTLARRQGDQTITIHAAGVRTDATKTVKRPASR